jgi:hypothetical protein
MESTYLTLILETKVPQSFLNLGIILILVLGFYSGLSCRTLIFSMNFSYLSKTPLPSHIAQFYHPNLLNSARVINLIITQPDPKQPETMLFSQSFRSLTHGDQLFLRNRHLCSYSRISQHFMEAEGSLSCSQEPYICPYLEPDQSNSYYPIISLQDPF